MERIRWSEKPIPFRTVVDNPTVTKPALVRIGNRLAIVADKLHGEFILASPCQRKEGRTIALDKTIVVTSKNPALWKVISKTTSKREGLIHRLTTQDLESVHKKDVQNARASPRTYVCLKEIEAFELIIRSQDPSIVNGQRVERIPKRIGENIEFHITDIGEVEFTPSEGEITSQDFVKTPNARSVKLLNALVPGVGGPERLIRNRVLRTIFCTTKNENQKRHFLLEVNEQPVDIRPIASDGSSELRYLQSTKNLFDYLSTYGNDTTLEVKVIRGDPPEKATDLGGLMVFRTALSGERIPLCRIDDLEITLAAPDLPIRVRLPSATESGWRSSSDTRRAEHQIMQLSVALLSHHESQMFLQIETENLSGHFFQTYRDEQTSTNVRSTEENPKKHSNLNSTTTKLSNQSRSLQARTSLNVDNRQLSKSSTLDHHDSPRTSRAMPSVTHPTASERIHQEDQRQSSQSNRKGERSRVELAERPSFAHRTTVREKPSTTTTKSSVGSIPK